MKRMLMLVLGACLAGSVSFAADTEHKEETTMDTSKNPLTGTEKVEKKHKKKMKGMHGQHDETVTETTKTHRDGSKETSTKTETDTKTK